MHSLPGKPRLILTREQIVGIFNGTYRQWNNTVFQETNPDLELPSKPIQVIVRADKSGSTEILTRSLTSFSEDWANEYGTFSRGLTLDGKPEHWNDTVVSYYGRGVFDVLFLLSVFPYCIGYVALSDAVGDGVAYAAIVNKAGEVVDANVQSVHNAIESSSDSLTSRLTASLSDSSSPGAYPIVGYTYLIVRMSNNSDCDVAKELVRFIKWFLSSPVAERTCEEHGFALVSESVKQKINRLVLEKMKCNRKFVHALVQKDIDWELAQERYRVLELPLKIALPILITVFLVAGVVIIYLRVKAYRALDCHDWNIAIEDVVFFEPGTMSFSRSRSRSQKSTMSIESKRESFNPEEATMSDIIHWPAKWNNHTVSVKIQHPFKLRVISSRSRRELSSCISTLVHENVVRFFGLTTVGEERYIVTEYCSKGVLQDILHDDKLNLNTSLKFSIAADIISGLQFLHANSLVHGHLTTESCLLDTRWTVKISDWEVGLVKSCVSPEIDDHMVSQSQLYSVHEDENKKALRNFFTAPEVIKSHFKDTPTTASDVYSFAICLHEIFTRDEPFSEHAESIAPREVLVLILMNNLRPMPTEEIPGKVRQIMEISWADNPESRPTASQVAGMMKKANPGKRSVMDSMMETLEEYAVHLEKTIEEKATELELVKQSALHSKSSLLPKWLAEKISNHEIIRSMNLYRSCIACVGFSGLSAIVETSGADIAVDILNEIFHQIVECVREEDFILVPHLKTPIIIAPFSDHMTEHAWVTNVVEILQGLMTKALEANKKNQGADPCSVKLRVALHLGSATISYVQSLSQLIAFGGGVEMVKVLVEHSSDSSFLVSNDVFQVLGKSRQHHFSSGNKVRLKVSVKTA